MTSLNLNWHDLHKMEKAVISSPLTTHHEYRCIGCEDFPTLEESREYYRWLRKQYVDTMAELAYAERYLS